MRRREAAQLLHQHLPVPGLHPNSRLVFEARARAQMGGHEGRRRLQELVTQVNQQLAAVGRFTELSRWLDHFAVHGEWTEGQPATPGTRERSGQPESEPSESGHG